MYVLPVFVQMSMQPNVLQYSTVQLTCKDKKGVTMVKPFPIYFVSICLPVALLKELHSSTCSVSTAMLSSLNCFI